MRRTSSMQLVRLELIHGADMSCDLLVCTSSNIKTTASSPSCVSLVRRADNPRWALHWHPRYRPTRTSTPHRPPDRYRHRLRSPAPPCSAEKHLHTQPQQHTEYLQRLLVEFASSSKRHKTVHACMGSEFRRRVMTRSRSSSRLWTIARKLISDAELIFDSTVVWSTHTAIVGHLNHYLWLKNTQKSRI